MTASPTTTSHEGTKERVHSAECHLYDAECAVQYARQTHVDAWIAAASDKLHDAIAEHLAAIAAFERS